MGASALLYCKCRPKFKILLNNNDNVCCDYKTKITFSCHSYLYYSQFYSTHETMANSDWPITDHGMRKKAFTIEVRYSPICEKDF